MKDFSIVIPVRGNINGLRVTLGAFNLFTANKDGLEVILVVDDDDEDASFYIKLKGMYAYDIRVLLVKHSDHFCMDYYNAGANIAVGANIMMFNDDCYVQTNNWDKIILDKISINPQFNGVYLVSLMDSTFYDIKDMLFPRFPMISRKAVEAVGFFFYPQVRMWPADKCIWDLYKAVGCIITCHEVKLQHDHIYAHKSDPSKSRMQRILNEDIASGIFPIDGNEQANKLFAVIKDKK